MARKEKVKQGEPFYEQLRLALNHFRDIEWLGSHSPLAAPYFLGDALRHTNTTVTIHDRGRALQRELQTAAASLWPGNLPHDKESLTTAVNEERREIGNKGSGYYYLLLELRYLRNYFKNSDPQADRESDIRAFLGISRGPYFNHVKAARQALGQALLRQLQPTFRLERPLTSSKPLIGRQAVLSQLKSALTNQQTVTITGRGGTGKTALATTLAGQWPTAVFWFTLRPTFNDQLNSLLFALGYFLHQQKASNLWLQLVADQGSIHDPNLALALVRGDLEQLNNKRPLLCFDEIDNLYHDDPDKVSYTKLQIREFLNGLSGHSPLLLIGQHHPLPADEHITLSGLNREQTITLLDEANIPFTAEEASYLHTYTGGNPRLLNLCITLYDHGKPLSNLTTELTEAPAFQALFTHLWQQLDQSERALLQCLAVFRSPAPEDAWAKQYPTLGNLLKRQIIQRDKSGGIILLPSLRDFIYSDRRWLSADLREKYHLWAAIVRATRGEYTAAAYHYLQAGEAEKAIQVWFTHRQQEIDRGQAAAALSLFSQIPLRRLPQAEKEALALLRAELNELIGNAEKGLAELEAIEWVNDSELAADAILLQSTFLNALGYPETAVERNEQGITVIIRLLRRLTRYRYQRGISQLKHRQIQAAWHETQLAQYEAGRLKGLVEEEQGHYQDALNSYHQALAIVKQINNKAGIAQLNQELAGIYGRMAKLEDAQKHAQAALDYYEQKGDRLSQEKLRCNLSQAYIQSGQFKRAIELATPALAFFEQAKLTHWAAVTAANLAEASFECGQLQEATTYAHQVLSIEVPHTYPYAWYTLGLVARQQQDQTAAIKAFQTCQQLADDNEDKFIGAYAWQALGELWHATKQLDKASNAFANAYTQFKQMGLEAEAKQTQNLRQQLATAS